MRGPDGGVQAFPRQKLSHFVRVSFMQESPE